MTGLAAKIGTLTRGKKIGRDKLDRSDSKKNEMYEEV